MPQRVLEFFSKHMGSHFVPLLKQRVMGLAEDFWADGPINLLRLDFNVQSFSLSNKPQTSRSPPRPTTTAAKPTEPAFKPHINYWHAEPGEISEKMWGDGFVTPGDDSLNTMLIKPLGLTKEMSVLDLSAGLGGRMRKTAEETGAYITGLEPDASIAARGMQLSVRAGKAKHATITAYDPAKLVLSRAYDCIVARETFYRAPDRATFFASIAQHSKPKAQVAFTDYILDKEHLENPAVVAWRANEKLANPCGLVEMAELWAKVGFNLRVHEDLTDFYKAEVKTGLQRLMQFLATGIKPDKETGGALLRRIETWNHRMAAMEAGMKFYRFYGTKR